MHEIVTLQFGQQSNYLGTHFWNTQESYFTYPPEPESPVNHDILFRPGIAPDGSDTYTPRTLIYDLKGGFGSMRKISALYETEDEVNQEISGAWPTKPIIQRSEPIPENPYQINLSANLPTPQLKSSSIHYWSDYTRLFYHPRSIHQLSEFTVNDTLNPFESFDVGLDLFEKLEREDDLVDRDLRPFIEECDGLQGVQVFTGVDGAWGGWACGWMERLRDELGKKSIWTWGVGDQGANTTISREKRLQQLANAARCLNIFAEQASVYVPITNTPFQRPSYLAFEPTSPWHVGAMQAVALESVTIPSRLRSSERGRGTLQDMEEAINSTGKRRIAKLGLSLADPDVLASRSASDSRQPDKTASTVYGEDEEGDDLRSFDIDVFTKDYRVSRVGPRKKEHIFGRVETARGNWDLEDADQRDPHDRFNEGPAMQRYNAPLLFPVLDSYPSIFKLGSGSGQKLAVHTGLTTSSAVAAEVRAVEYIVRRLGGIEEKEALCNGLQVIAEEYDEGWDSGTDSDGDDD